MNEDTKQQLMTVGVALLMALVERWLGKTKSVEASSILELGENVVKKAFNKDQKI